MFTMFEWELKGANDDECSFVLPLKKGKEYQIGRTRQIDIVCTSPLVSRKHAVITVDDDNTVLIKDTNSSNGIFINDVKVQPNVYVKLKHLDLIGVGCPKDAIEQKKDFFQLYNNLAFNEAIPSLTPDGCVNKDEEATKTLSSNGVIEISDSENESDVGPSHDENNSILTDLENIQITEDPNIKTESVTDDPNVNDIRIKTEQIRVHENMECDEKSNDILENENQDDEEFSIPDSLQNFINNPPDVMEDNNSDDDIFPASQLFNEEQFVEMKQEPEFNSKQDDNFENIFTNIKRENIYEEDDYGEVNLFECESDFEDDDKKWFERLSQSIKKEETDDVTDGSLKDKLSSIAKNYLSDILKDSINETVEIESIVDVPSEEKDEQTGDVEKPDVSKEETVRVPRVVIERHPVVEIKTRTEKISELTPEKVPEEEKLPSEPEESRVTVQDNVETISTTPKLQKILDNLFGDEQVEKEVVKKSTNQNKKYTVPPVIEAPFLKKGKRKAHESKNTVSSTEKKILKRKFSTEDRSKSPVPKKKSTPKVSDKAIREEFEKRSSNKRHSRISEESISNKSKQQIKEERKKKLKKITEKHTKEENNDTRVKNVTKPRVKNSGGRGGFLINEAELDVPKKKFVIPKKKVIDIPIDNEVIQTAKQSCLPKTKRTSSIETQSKPGKKSVRFKTENLVQIRVFEIEDGNKLLPCNFKDAPIPTAARQPRKHPVGASFDDSEALKSVLVWNPNWLEECQHINTPPKVSSYRPMQMLHKFNSPGDYYHIVTPLLLLELWEDAYREWKYSKKKCVLAADIRDVTLESSAKHHFTKIVCNCYLSKWENENNLHPNRGELIILDVMVNKNNKAEYEQKFGYVQHFYKKKVFNQENLDVARLKKMKVSLPVEWIVTLTVCTKPLQDMKTDKPIRVRSIFYIAPCLRIFNAVARLSNSPLCSHILSPTVDKFKIPRVVDSKVVIKDKLDPIQLKCVLEASRLCSGSEPGIYMIQGPPGTGKSSVIVNIIFQLLYGEKRPKECILLCAPSNGAIDEITVRLLDLRSQLEKSLRFKMLRIGQLNSIHARVKDISLQSLVKKNVKEVTDSYINANGLLKDDLNFRESKINMLSNKIHSMQARGEPTNEIEEQLKKAKADLNMFYTRHAREMTHEERRKLERKSEQDLIEGADIICTTLSSSGVTRMEELYRHNRLHFSCCIVDEATQSNEQETLIPLMLGVSKLVLVGDPAQLPATVLSTEAKNLGYGQSLFARLQNCLEHLPENPVRMLQTQYRMHEDICRFPNQQFYCGKLKTPPSLCRENPSFYPYRIFSLKLSRHQSDEYLNKPEADFVLMIANIVLQRSKMSIGIITSYSNQKHYITAKFEEMMKGMKNPRVDINTVDSFQGQERDVIIYSPVRYRTNGFLSDIQRINVSFTRARYALYVCAQDQLFSTDQIWKQVEMDGLSRHCLFRLTENEVFNEQKITNLVVKKQKDKHKTKP